MKTKRHITCEVTLIDNLLTVKCSFIRSLIIDESITQASQKEPVAVILLVVCSRLFLLTSH